METKETKIVICLILLAGLLILPLVGHSGNLEPSGPPNSTMKTLDEVEPRTPISSVPYTIAESSSYYLSANAQMTNNMFNGITIWADNVTLDLKGFSLIGDGTAGKHGVVIEGDYKNITIRNGTITNWGGNGVEAATASKCLIEDVQVISNAGSGIHLGGNEQRVKNCVVSGNGTSASSNVYGIYVEESSIVTGCTVSGNGHSATSEVKGIYAGNSSTVTGNTTYDNGNSAAGDAYGINASGGSTVTGNMAYYNGVLAASSNVYGISLGEYNLVDQNTAYKNGTGAASATNMTLGVTGCVYVNNVAP